LNPARCAFAGAAQVVERAGRVGQGRRSSLPRLGALAAAALLSGCGFTFFGLFGEDKSIQTRAIEFEVAQGANQDSPIALDIVYVHDEQMVPLLLQMTAHDWFQKRGQMTQAFPTGFELASYEVVPGQKGPTAAVTGKTKDAIAAFLFANYASDGTHRARLDALEHPVIELGAKDFTVLPARTASR
jgi:type VI secretion system protein